MGGATTTEETKTVLPDEHLHDSGGPFVVETLMEEERTIFAEEEKTSGAFWEEEKCATEEKEETVNAIENGDHVDPNSEEAYLHKIMTELDGIEAAGKMGYEGEKYNYAYGEYKRGLKSLSDLVVGKKTQEDVELKALYMKRRRKFCANAAAACIKIGYWQQGLEACTLILSEGPDDEMQRRKALFRSGVCARGMGELDEAAAFHKKLLETPDLDAGTKRDIAKQLKGIAEEKKRYKKFCKNIVSKKNQDSIIVPEKAELTMEQLEEKAELEKKRKEYEERKKARAELDKPTRIEPTKPAIMMNEDDCISMLDVLAERYGDEKIQDQLKQAAYDHGLQFGKGFILKSRMILAPLQRDLLVKHGFLNPSDVIVDEYDSVEAGDVPIAKTKQAVKRGMFEDSLGNLSLMGEGVRERSDKEVYSVALYSDEKTKASISSTPKSEAIVMLSAVLNSSKDVTIILKLSAELSVQDLVAEITSLIPSGTANDGVMAANISSVIFKTEKEVFPKGSTVKFVCMNHGVEIAIDGEEIGGVRGLSEALIDGYLKDQTVSPTLLLSVMDNCCCGEGYLEIPHQSKPDKRVTKAESDSAHFEAIRKFQHTVRYLGAKNKDIDEKAVLCQKLAIGLLYEDTMRQTGWVSL